MCLPHRLRWHDVRVKTEGLVLIEHRGNLVFVAVDDCVLEHQLRLPLVLLVD